MINRLVFTLATGCLLSCLSAVALGDQNDDAVGTASDSDDEFSFMKLLAEHGAHDLERERWNAYGQLTYISSWKAPFHAPYTNLNGSNHSLSPHGEHSFTATATLFFGVALWPGAAAYFVPEMISSRPLSNLAGLGGAIQNFELQKQGSIRPSIYSSRLYLTQTIDLGGRRTDGDSGPMQLGTALSSRRIQFAVGNFSVLDFFDRNSVVGDPRRQFFNIAFLTHSAFDFAADSRGYTWGGVVELHYDDWALRFGRFAVPKQPNQFKLDPQIFEHYGDQLEFEHAHHVLGEEGAVRLVAYRNRENMGSYAEAVGAFEADPNKNAAACPGFSYDSANEMAPDLCWVRRDHVKIGLGVSFEQQVSKDVGLFARAMVSDGRTEVYSYTSSDRSASAGAAVRGGAWRRAEDVVGVAYAANVISSSHAQYLKLGGVDAFIGDGTLKRGAEQVFELFYSLSFHGPTALSADYQHIWNPAFNVDRGPVNVLSGRLHAEF